LIGLDVRPAPDDQASATSMALLTLYQGCCNIITLDVASGAPDDQASATSVWPFTLAVSKLLTVIGLDVRPPRAIRPAPPRWPFTLTPYQRLCDHPYRLDYSLLPGSQASATSL
jgi:hypothetical protein